MGEDTQQASTVQTFMNWTLLCFPLNMEKIVITLVFGCVCVIKCWANATVVRGCDKSINVFTFTGTPEIFAGNSYNLTSALTVIINVANIEVIGDAAITREMESHAGSISDIFSGVVPHVPA